MKYLINNMMSKLTNKLTVLGVILFSVVLVSACDEEKYADWKIMNDQWFEEFKKIHKKDSNFVETTSGLCYHEIYRNEYKYARPHPNSRVKVTYKGQLISGKVFEEKEDAFVYLQQAVMGWQEGLQLMRDGWHFVFYIPANLAYGSKGQGLVPPHSVLKFDIELKKTDNY